MASWIVLNDQLLNLDQALVVSHGKQNGATVARLHFPEFGEVRLTGGDADRALDQLEMDRHNADVLRDVLAGILDRLEKALAPPREDLPFGGRRAA
jgi:hypothetical protein